MYEINPKIKGHFILQHLALVYAVICQPFVDECQFRCRANACGICGGQSSTWTGIPPYHPMTAVYPYSSSFSSTNFTLYQDRREKPGNLKNAMLFRKSCSISCKSTYTLRDSKRWEDMEINVYPTRCRIALNIFAPFYPNNLISNPGAL
jgi:hypothetical protein